MAVVVLGPECLLLSPLLFQPVLTRKSGARRPGRELGAALPPGAPYAPTPLPAPPAAAAGLGLYRASRDRRGEAGRGGAGGGGVGRRGAGPAAPGPGARGRLAGRTSLLHGECWSTSYRSLGQGAPSARLLLPPPLPAAAASTIV